jgi:hypothetical protein
VIKSYAVAVLLLSMLLIAAAYGSAFLPGGTPAWAPWAMVVGMSASMVAMMVLGAARDGRVGKLVFPFAFVFVVFVAGFGIALAHPGTDPADPVLWLGLPPRAAIVLYVIGFLPLFVVPVADALTFDEQTLRVEDLERIRRHRTADELPPRDASMRAASRPAAKAVR